MNKTPPLYGGRFAIMKCTEEFCKSEKELLSALLHQPEAKLKWKNAKIALLACQYDKCKKTLKSSLRTILNDSQKNKLFIKDKKQVQKLERLYDRGMKLLNNPNAMATDYIKFYMDMAS